MPWLRFTADFDFSYHPASETAYKAGMVLNVPRSCAAAATAAGRAVLLTKRNRSEPPMEIASEDAGEAPAEVVTEEAGDPPDEAPIDGD